jgi:hypothetical protein
VSYLSYSALAEIDLQLGFDPDFDRSAARGFM